MLNKKTAKRFNLKFMIVLLSVGVALLSIPFLCLSYTSYEKKAEYCITNREYINVSLQAILNGKFDDGEKQTDRNGYVHIDIENSLKKETIIYKGDEVVCFRIKNPELMISDIRGAFWQGNEADNGSFVEFFSEEYTKCPYSTDENVYEYYVLENGTVICLCPKCE